MKKIKTLFLPVCFFVNSTIISQTEKEANTFFNLDKFIKALPYYERSVKENPDDEKINYRLAVCYLNVNGDKTRAIPYLEKVTKMSSANPNAWYLLGRAYQFAYRFDDAIKAFEKFKTISKGTNYNLNDVDNQIQYCYNAKELMKFPRNVKFENLGPNVNSKYDDYFPFVPVDESFIVFSTRRDDGSAEDIDGRFLPEVYISYKYEGQYRPAKMLGKPLSNLDGAEEIIGMTADGRRMLFYIENDEYAGDIFMASFENKKISRLKRLEKEINSKYYEIAACFSPDGDEIYFASDRPGGYGGVDLWVVRKLPNGNWGIPQNLGPEINTPFDEDFPNISPDGKYLFFSSKGHTSMGGYDIFRAEWDEEKRAWVKPVNIGFPINTPDDDMNFRITGNGRYGYMSINRKENLGGLDIYRLVFEDVEPKYTVITGYLLKSDSVTKAEGGRLMVIDRNGDIFGDYLPNPNTGKYVIAVPAGKYTVEAENADGKIVRFDIEVFDDVSYKPEIQRDIVFKP